jgi:hypothetical protein
MSPTDDDIRAMLAARADRAIVGATPADALLAAARERAVADPRTRRGRFGVVRPMPMLAGGVASLAVLAIAVVLVAVPLTSRPPASAVPSGGPSMAVASSGPPASPAANPSPDVRILTTRELADLIASRGADLAGLTIAVRGEIVDPLPGCRGGAYCPPAALAGTAIAVRPVGDIGPGPWDGSGSKSGFFALRLTSGAGGAAGPIAAEYLGDIRPAKDGLAWSVADLVAGKAREETGFVAVRGWLVRTPLHSCPSIQRPAFGCPSDDFITPDRFQPLHADGSSSGPSDGLYLPSGTYGEWAPEPTSFGLGVEPREATYLMAWTAVAPWCAPNADCYVGPESFHWLIRGRLDPIPSDASKPEPTPDVGYYPGGIPRSVDGEPVLVGLDTQKRLAEATDDTSFLAGGFASYGPALCSGGLGQRDPNPLAQGCPRYQIAGLPGQLYGDLEVGDVPLVVRVHAHDREAEACLPETIDYCRARVRIEGVVWSGDEATTAAPIGPGDAIGRVLAIAFREDREVADGSIFSVDEPRFVMPISCPTPWPTLAYSIRGDPRLGLLAVFPHEKARAAFQTSIASPADGPCSGSPIDRGNPPRWIGQDNILVLAYADDPIAAEIAAQLASVDGTPRNTIPLPDASIDRSAETLLDYLDSRAAGPNAQGDAPSLTFGPVPANADGNPAIDLDAGWAQDVLRRFEAGALDGDVELVTELPSTAQLGEAASVINAAGATGTLRSWLYRVTYSESTDPRLASETFAVFQNSDSTYRDWGIVRVDGEPFPVVPIPPRVEVPLPSEVEPINDGSSDRPCLPAGQECP